MSPEMLALLAESLGETLYMVGVSAAISTLFGVPLGVILVTTSRGHILENVLINRVLGAIANATRSTPFIILMVAIIPLTRILAGTSIGTNAAIVPLSIAAIPFVGRIVESSLRKVDYGLIEAAQAMGASPFQIIRLVLLPEAMPSIVLGITLSVISLIGYSAMAGAIGGGGLGDLAIRFGYQRFRVDIMIATVVILIALVQLVQSAGDFVSHRLNKKQKARGDHSCKSPENRWPSFSASSLCLPWRQGAAAKTNRPSPLRRRRPTNRSKSALLRDHTHKSCKSSKKSPKRMA